MFRSTSRFFSRFTVSALFILLVTASLLLYTVPMTSAAPAAVVNPSLEQTTGGIPDCFTQGGWGTHTVSWALTTAAHTGTSAQSLTISNYVSGDRKLMMTENTTCAPTVTAGAT